MTVSTVCRPCAAGRVARVARAPEPAEQRVEFVVVGGSDPRSFMSIDEARHHATTAGGKVRSRAIVNR